MSDSSTIRCSRPPLVWGLIALRLTQPIILLQLGANMAGVVMVFSSLHILYINMKFLPKELQPRLWRRLALIFMAIFYGFFVYLWLMGGLVPDREKGFLFSLTKIHRPRVGSYFGSGTKTNHEITRSKHKIKHVSCDFVVLSFVCCEYSSVRRLDAIGKRNWSSALSLDLLDLFGQHRHRFKQIADDSVVSNVEDRRFGIFVDGHDRS